VKPIPGHRRPRWGWRCICRGLRHRLRLQEEDKRGAHFFSPRFYLKQWILINCRWRAFQMIWTMIIWGIWASGPVSIKMRLHYRVRGKFSSSKEQNQFFARRVLLVEQTRRPNSALSSIAPFMRKIWRFSVTLLRGHVQKRCTCRRLNIFSEAGGLWYMGLRSCIIALRLDNRLQSNSKTPNNGW
jgi:hypothetical protein